MNRNKSKNLFVWICAAPAIILFALFMLVPTFNIFRIALFKWTGLGADMEFVGLGNFTKLIQDVSFIRAMQNQIFYIATTTVFTMSIALVFASILVREKLKGTNFFRVIFYIPNILSVVVIAVIFSQIYDAGSQGLLNSLIGLFKPENWETIKFLGDQKIVPYAVAGGLIWQGIGYYMVMYMAAMSTIPEHLYEAASLEGAGKMKQFFTITIPLVWDNIRTTLTFFIISTINISFLLVTALTQGGPDGASETALGYMYTQAFTNASYGYAMAIGVVIFIFSFALSALVNKATERDVLQY